MSSNATPTIVGKNTNQKAKKKKNKKKRNKVTRPADWDEYDEYEKFNYFTYVDPYIPFAGTYTEMDRIYDEKYHKDGKSNFFSPDAIAEVANGYCEPIDLDDSYYR